MAEIACRSCGRILQAPGRQSRARAVTACPRCGAGLRVGGGASSPDPDLEALFGAEPTGAAARSAETVGVYGPSGTLLRPRAPSAPARPRQVLKLEGRLSLRSGSDGRQQYRITGERTVVGREQADLTFPDPTLSRSHFQIEAKGAEFFLRDLGSSNGTYLNGHRVRTAQLTSGDEIRAGETTFLFNTLQVIPVG